MRHGKCTGFKIKGGIKKMDKRAQRKHRKELKRKKIRHNIRLYGKQIPREPEADILDFEELAKKTGFGPLKR